VLFSLDFANYCIKALHVLLPTMRYLTYLIDLPMESDGNNVDKLDQVEKVHKEHVDTVRTHFNSKIKKLEMQLSLSQKALESKKTILNNFKEQLRVESPKLSKSLLDLLNNSRNGRVEEYESFHQEVVFELEAQLNRMRKECLEEVEEVRRKLKEEIGRQKEKYEGYLKEIKECHQMERTSLENRISRLQAENVELKSNRHPSMDSSFQSDVSKELSMTHLVQQLTEMTSKYSDLKIKSNRDIANIKDKNSQLMTELKDVKEKADKFKLKSDELAKSSKDELNRLKARIKLVEKSKKEAEEKVKEIGELRKQVTILKNDIEKTEESEKKLKDAIKKKKEQLVKEKTFRKNASMKDLSQTKKVTEVNNKLEKDMRNIKNNYNKLKEENKILKSRLSDLVANKESNHAYYMTGQPSKPNSSFAVPLNYMGSNFNAKDYQTHDGRKSIDVIQNMQKKKLDGRAISYKNLPTLSEINTKEFHSLYKSPRRSCTNLNKSSFFFGEKRRCISQDKVIGDLDNGSCRYCET
jgi:hypothetical protein